MTGNGDRMIDEGSPAGPYEFDGYAEGTVRAEGLELSDAVIERNAVGHYYIVGYLPGGIRVAGWLHERPLPQNAKEGENGTST